MKKNTVLSIKDIERKANSIRKSIISSLLLAGSGHSAGPLGLADVFASLYFAVLKHNPKKPDWEERDRFILSAGHVCPVWYATLAEAGYFSKTLLKKLRKFSSPLQGHPHKNIAYGIENTAGPLAQGISVAAGIAKSFKIDGKKNMVFCVMGDGEQQEGQVWEAVMFSAHHKLDNLVVIIDKNNIQIDGFVDQIMGIEPIIEKYRSFGWHVQEVDGHNIEMIIDACNVARSVHSRPSVIIAQTIPGKGVDFMENDFHWHGKPPIESEAKLALKELRSLDGKIDFE